MKKTLSMPAKNLLYNVKRSFLQSSADESFLDFHESEYASLKALTADDRCNLRHLLLRDLQQCQNAVFLNHLMYAPAFFVKLNTEDTHLTDESIDTACAGTSCFQASHSAFEKFCESLSCELSSKRTKLVVACVHEDSHEMLRIYLSSSCRHALQDADRIRICTAFDDIASFAEFSAQFPFDHSQFLKFERIATEHFQASEDEFSTAYDTHAASEENVLKLLQVPVENATEIHQLATSIESILDSANHQHVVECIVQSQSSRSALQILSKCPQSLEIPFAHVMQTILSSYVEESYDERNSYNLRESFGILTDFMVLRHKNGAEDEHAFIRSISCVLPKENQLIFDVLCPPSADELFLSTNSVYMGMFTSLLKDTQNIADFAQYLQQQLPEVPLLAESLLRDPMLKARFSNFDEDKIQRLQLASHVVFGNDHQLFKEFGVFSAFRSNVTDLTELTGIIDTFNLSFEDSLMLLTNHSVFHAVTMNIITTEEELKQKLSPPSTQVAARI